MKRLCILPALFALALFASCQKQQTEEERRAEVERQVQDRLAAEHQAQQQQQLDQQAADLKAREDALALKQQQLAQTTPTPSDEAGTFATTTENTTASESTARSRHRARRHSSEEYGMFYEKLEPYGDWIETNDYGYVWQPRVAQESHNWRPYTDGHWVYTDAGWTWVSDEPYGWAAYHYGRWTRLRGVGWVWVPGDEWAPAWVSWRTSNQYVGWAPLPPEAEIVRGEQVGNWADSYYDIGPEQYVFVPTDEVGVQRVATVAVPAERNVTIITETRNVTNITYNNTTIVNYGPNYDQLRAASRQPIERYQLQRETTMQGQAAPVVRGEVIAFPAPSVAPLPNVQRPPVVKKTITNAVVENGWSGISNKAAAEQARAKIMAEATPPPNAPAKVATETGPAAARSASPAASAGAPTAAPMITSTPRASATPVPTRTPAASATASAAAAPSRPAFSPRPSMTPRASATATPHAVATAAAQASSSASPAASPSASGAAVSPTPRGRPTPPFVRPSVSPRASLPDQLTSPGPEKASPPASAPAEKTTPPAARPIATIPARFHHTPPPVAPSASPTVGAENAAVTPGRPNPAAKPPQPADREAARAAEELRREQFRNAKQREAAQLTPPPVHSPAAASPSAAPSAAEKPPGLRTTPASGRSESVERAASSLATPAKPPVPAAEHTPARAAASPPFATPPARTPQQLPGQQQHGPHRPQVSPSPTASAAP